MTSPSSAEPTFKASPTTGFTLIEISIMLVIIGLIVGGIPLYPVAFVLFNR